MKWRKALLKKVFVGSIVIIVAIMVTTFLLDTLGIMERHINYPVITGVVVILFIMYLINRQGHDWVGTPFVLFLILGITLIDPPHRAFDGSNILMLVLPMLASSYLISPNAPFYLLPLIIGDLFLLSYLAGEGYWGVVPSPSTIGVIIITAIVSWAGAFHVQNALENVEKQNFKLLKTKKNLKKDISKLKKTRKSLETDIHGMKVFQKAAVGRELRMVELKKELQEVIENKKNEKHEETQKSK